jgi:hypothetical protein
MITTSACATRLAHFGLLAVQPARQHRLSVATNAHRRLTLFRRFIRYLNKLHTQRLHLLLDTGPTSDA